MSGKKKKSKRTYGEGTISFDKNNNRYVGKIDLGKGLDGKRKRKTVYGKSEPEVKQKLKQLSVDIFTGNFLDNSDITIYHLGKQILDDKFNLGRVKDATYHRSLETLKHLSSTYNTPLQDCNVTHIKRFLLSEAFFLKRYRLY